MTATASPFAASNATFRIWGMVVSAGTGSTLASGNRRVTSARTPSPRRSTTTISRDTSEDCAWSAVRQPIRSPSPLTEGTTTDRSTGIATLERASRATDVSHRFAHGPRRDEREGRGQRAEECTPPRRRGGAGDTRENDDRQQRSHRREQPATCIPFLDQPRPRVIAAML